MAVCHYTPRQKFIQACSKSLSILLEKIPDKLIMTQFPISNRENCKFSIIGRAVPDIEIIAIDTGCDVRHSLAYVFYTKIS